MSQSLKAQEQQRLSDLLPADFMWGDSLTPDVLRDILSAQQGAQEPEHRGYAHLGTGQYLLNHSAALPAELVISVATEGEKAGRVVGDDRENVDGTVIMPDDMCVRIRFENVAGLDALEKQLRYLRDAHFPATKTEQGAQEPVGTVKRNNLYDAYISWTHEIPVSGTKLYTNPATKAQEPSTTGSK